jgi:hypothetical protein
MPEQDYCIRSFKKKIWNEQSDEKSVASSLTSKQWGSLNSALLSNKNSISMPMSTTTKYIFHHSGKAKAKAISNIF